jgi:hypothetical protein
LFAAFVILLFVPSGMVIQLTNGTPARHVYFWWAYAPEFLVNTGFRFRMVDRSMTMVTHLIASVLLGCLFQLGSWSFRRFAGTIK